MSVVTVRETPFDRYAVVYCGVTMGQPYETRKAARQAARRLAERESAELRLDGHQTSRFELFGR